MSNREAPPGRARHTLPRRTRAGSSLALRPERARSALVLGLVGLCWLLASGCEREPTAPFADVTADVGIDFIQFNGMSGEYYFCEIVGAGAALFDYDGDGDLDLYLCQGAMLGEGKRIEQAKYPPRGEVPPIDRLYKNLLVETKRLSFEDVTQRSKLHSSGYGMGVAAGDYDNDGDVDLYLSKFDDNEFWENNGDGTFQDVTQRTGTTEPRWSSSSAFVDYDADGWLDLYVCNYVNFTTAANKPCYSKTSARDYCGPQSFDPYPDRLFRNRGDGTFEDVSAVSGIAASAGSSLGVVAADVNGDGWLDIAVANDGDPNHLFINQRDGTFVDDAFLAGAAVNMNGRPEAGMGIDLADFDRDGDFDLFVTHLIGETNTYWRNNGRGFFQDITTQTGLGHPSRAFTGFGTGAIDYDNDGWLDIATVNGAVYSIEALERAGDPFPLHQKNSLYRNLGGAKFEDVSARSGSFCELSEVHRGAAFGDIDNDGDMDIVVTSNNGPARVMRNQVGTQNAWVRFSVRDPSNRWDLLGARIEVRLADGRTLAERVRTDVSYLCASDPRPLVGLGSAVGFESVTVRYPRGEGEEWRGLGPRAHHVLVRGTGTALPKLAVAAGDGGAKAGTR